MAGGRRAFPNLNGASYALALSPDHRRLAVGSLAVGHTKSTFRIYDVVTGAAVSTLTDLETVGSEGAFVFAWSLTLRGLDAARCRHPPERRCVRVGFHHGAAAVHQSRRERLDDRVCVYRRRCRDGRWRQQPGPFRKASTLEPTAEPIRGRVAVRASTHPTLPLLLTDGVCGPLEETFGYRDHALWDAEHAIEIGKGFLLNCGFWLLDGSGFVAKDLTSIQIWDIDRDKWMLAACKFVGRNLSQAEWERYGPKKDYRQTCE